MDLTQKFTLGEKLTEEQKSFFNRYGFIHFESFLSPEQTQGLLKAVQDVEKQWIHEGLTKVNGTPIKFGKDENGNQIVQRFAFTSLYSSHIHELLRDKRINALKQLVGGGEARIAENEKDGVVVNHFVNTGESNYSKLGWHTDGLRDLFNGYKLEPMLNVGIYLDDSTLEKGGLRILPGTHNQSLYHLLFKKRYFIDNNPDKEEIAVVAKAGDLTVHSGRIWHRVALSALQGLPSKRRVMYFPIIKGKYRPKSEKTRTPFYHKFQKFVK